MKYRYTKFTGDDLDELDLEELLSKLSDLLLGSGFDDPHGLYGDDEPGHSRQSLHDAIMEAILNGGMLSDETLERLLGKDWRDAEDAEQRLDALIEKIIEKLQAQGYLSGPPDLEARARAARGPGRRRRDGQSRTVPVRDHRQEPRLPRLRALRDLLGSLGKSSLGRHDTREMATGIEASGTSKPYEFGDTMNLDASGDDLNAVLRSRRDGRGPRRRQKNPELGPRPSDLDLGHRRRLRRPDGRAGRVPELVRDGADARLQPQHDPLRRGSLHAGEAGGAGAGQPDPAAVSRATR